MDCNEELLENGHKYRNHICSKCNRPARYTYSIIKNEDGIIDIRAGYHGQAPENQVYACGYHVCWRKWSKESRTDMERKCNLVLQRTLFMMGVT